MIQVLKGSGMNMIHPVFRLLAGRKTGGTINYEKRSYAGDPIKPGLASRRLATKPIRHSPANSIA